MKIKKYVLPISEEPVNIITESNYKVVTVNKDENDNLCVWMLVDDSSTAMEKHKFLVADENMNLSKFIKNPNAYIGSVSFGRFIVHVFDMGYQPI